MNRKLIALPIALVCWFSSWVATPAGQPPTVSADLADHLAGPHRHRVIVQADAGALAVLRRGAHGLLRRELNGAMALEVTDAQLDALKQNPMFAHISGDLPVGGDMAITNQVTAAAALWQGTSGGLLGLGGTPGDTGSGGGAGVPDSGDATPRAVDS